MSKRCKCGALKQQMAKTAHRKGDTSLGATNLRSSWRHYKRRWSCSSFWEIHRSSKRNRRWAIKTRVTSEERISVWQVMTWHTWHFKLLKQTIFLVVSADIKKWLGIKCTEDSLRAIMKHRWGNVGLHQRQGQRISTRNVWKIFLSSW
jgi:hypothetical protein